MLRRDTGRIWSCAMASAATCGRASAGGPCTAGCRGAHSPATGSACTAGADARAAGGSASTAAQTPSPAPCGLGGGPQALGHTPGARLTTCCPGAVGAPKHGRVGARLIVKYAGRRLAAHSQEGAAQLRHGGAVVIHRQLGSAACRAGRQDSAVGKSTMAGGTGCMHRTAAARARPHLCRTGGRTGAACP